MFAIGGHTPSQQKQEQRRVEHLKKKLLILQAAADSLREQYDLEQMDASQAAASSGQSTSAGTDVFLVHGRNERWLQETARFLEKITITPTILKEEPNRGLTIIEKLMAHSAGVGFAVVLLTADDYGGLLADPQKCQNRRARQNVILELGLFIGRLGRDRVCSLYEKGVELPSDYDGVGFVPLDEAGAWKVALAKELKAAEIPFDAGKLLD
jgi:predicted nucleotide-binding protein